MPTDTQTQNNETSAPEWVNTIQDESLRKDPNILKYKSVDDLAKGYVNASKLVGAKGVILPSEKATPEELNEFYGKLGRPDKSDGYKFNTPEKLHESVKATPEFQKAFADMVHSEGLTQKQADGIYNKYLKMWNDGATMQEKTSVENKTKAETALRSKWQGDFDKKLTTTKNVINKIAGEGAVDKFGDLGNNPDALEILEKLTSHFAEDSLGGKGMSTQSSPQQAQEVIDTLVKDSKSDFYSSDDSKRKIAIEKVKKAYATLHGGA